MELRFRSVKDESGILSERFVGDLAARFGLSTFIETGTYKGDTVFALRKKFPKLVSIELSRAYFEQAKRRFANEPAISLVQGDSAHCLADALAACGGSNALVWLDAHYSGGNTAKGEDNTPIVQELRAFEASAGSHVILIDDLRLFWNVSDGFDKHDSIAGYPAASIIVDCLEKIGGGYDCYALPDSLLAIPRKHRELYTVSPVLAACSKIRLGLQPSDNVDQLNASIAAASGDEAEAIVHIPDYLAQQAAYGLGGHYYYFRALVRRRLGDMAGAKSDAALAAKCGVQGLQGVA